MILPAKSTTKAYTAECQMILSHNNEYAVVLDACVLVPMPLCDTLLHLAEEPSFYRPLWSGKILQEVGDALENKLGLNERQRSRRLKVMQEAFPEALIVIPPRLEETFECPDEDDRHVIACAVKGQANAIITLNRRHFTPECLDEYGILCQHPDEFLVHQFYLAPQVVVEKLDVQAAAIGKKRSDTIKRLENVVPNFCRLLNKYFPL